MSGQRVGPWAEMDNNASGPRQPLLRKEEPQPSHFGACLCEGGSPGPQEELQICKDQSPGAKTWSLEQPRGSCSSFLRALVWIVELETLLVCAGRRLLCVPYFNPKRASSKSRTRKTLSSVAPIVLCGVNLLLLSKPFEVLM